MTDLSQPSASLHPYPGLRPFKSDEDYLFFGREEQVAELLHLLSKHRFVAVVGTSGSGKSSLVRCGLLSELEGGSMIKAGSHWDIAVMQPGGDPLRRLAQALADADLYDSGDPTVVPQILATLTRSRSGLVEAARQSELAEGCNLLLVVDQFEEIFRFHEAGKKGEEQAPDFIRLLLAACEQSEVPIYVVLTMRSDFLGDCPQFAGLAEAVNQGEYLIPRLSREQSQSAIEGPARVAGGEISRRLVQRLLNDLGSETEQLPVLQHALMRTWDRWLTDHAEGESVDLRHYEAVGGMQAALSRHADEVLEALPDQEHRNVVERIFKALTEKGADGRGIRRPTRRDDLGAIAAARREIVARVIEAYRRPGVTFLMPGQDVELGPESVIDISHESLMRVWERLRGWVEEESQSVRIFRRLSDTASLWTRREAGLYFDPDLQIATSWRDEARPNAAWALQYGGGFEAAIRFLEASRISADAAEREHEAARARELEQARLLAQTQTRAARNFKRFAASMLVVAVAALAAMGFAVIAQREAEEARAEVARTLGRSDFIRGASLLDQEQHLAEPGLRLLLDAHSHDSSAPAPLEKIHDTLLNRRLAIPELELSAGGPAVLSLAVRAAGEPKDDAPGSTLLAAGDEAGAVRLFELPSGRLLRSLSHDSAVVTLAFSDDGAKLAAATRDGKVYVWNPETGEEIAHYSEPGYPERPRIAALAISPDGEHILNQLEFSGSRWLAAGKIFPPANEGYHRREPPQSSPCARPLLRRGAGGYLIPDGGQVTRLVVMGEGVRLTPFAGTETGVGSVSALAVDASLTRFAVAKGPELRVLESAGAATSSRVLARSTSQVVDLDFSPDGRRLVVVEAPGGARILNVETGEVLTALPQEASFARAWFDPRGLLVLTVTVESEARVWLAETGEPVSAVFTHEGPYDINPFIGDGSRVLVRQSGNSLRILRSVSVPSLPLTLAHPNAVRGIAMDRTGALLASACADGTVRVWNAAGGTLRVALPLGSPVRSVEMSPDGARLMACAEGGDIRFWNVSDWRESLVIRTGPDELRIASAELSGDGRTVLANLEGGLGLDLFDSVSGARRCPTRRTEQRVSLAAVSADGRLVAAGTSDGKVLSWSVADPVRPLEIEAGEGAILSLRFHPSDSRFLFVTSFGTLRIVHRETGETSSFVKQEVVEGGWSPDGTSIVTRSADEAIRLWDGASGALLSTAPSRAAVIAASLGPTNDRVLRVRRDAVEVLDARTAQSLARHTISGARITQSQFTSNGHGVLMVAADGTVSLWDAGYEPSPEVDGALIHLAKSTLRGAGTEEPRSHATGPTTSLAAADRLRRWYGAGPDAQTLSPSRDLPLGTWLESSFARRDIDGLRWSLLLRPDDPLRRARLGLMRLRQPTPSPRDLFYSRLDLDDAAVKSSAVGEVAVLRALGLGMLGDAGEAAGAWARAAALGEPDLETAERWIALIDAVEREGGVLALQASAARDTLVDRAITLAEGATGDVKPTLTRLWIRRFELWLDQSERIGDKFFGQAREEWARLSARTDLSAAEAEHLLGRTLDTAGRVLAQASLAERREHEAFFAATALLRWLAPIQRGDLSLEWNKRPAFQTLPELVGPTTHLAERGATWRYLDDGSYPGSRWREPDYDDSSWKEGIGPLGFGDVHIKTSVRISRSSDLDGSQTITYYFRRQVELEEIPESPTLLFDVLRDDGVVLYVNGIEVFKDNLRRWPILATTLALRSIGGEDETRYLPVAMPLEPDGRSRLKKGRNVFAAEVHQYNRTSSDLGFDLACAAGWDPDGYLDTLSDERWDAILGAMERLLPVRLDDGALDASWRETALLTFARDPESFGKPGNSSAWLCRARFLRSRGPRFWEAALKAAEQAATLAQEARTGSVDARLLLEPSLVFRSDLLTRLGRPSAPGLPGRDPALDRSLIDLGALYNANYFQGSFDWHDEDNAPARTARVPWVVTSLRGVRYDVRGLIQLNSGRYPDDESMDTRVRGKDINESYGKEWPDQVSIPLGRRAKSVGFLGSAIFGRGDAVNIGEDPIARYVFHYQDGSSVAEPVRWRRDVVDWFQASLGDLRSLGWFDRGPSGNDGPFSGAAFSEKIWRNPHPEKVITSIDFVSAKIPAVPFLLGVTVIEE